MAMPPGNAGILPAGFRLAGWKPALPGTATTAMMPTRATSESRSRQVQDHSGVEIGDCSDWSGCSGHERAP